jgi:hypothetical protein
MKLCDHKHGGRHGGRLGLAVGSANARAADMDIVDTAVGAGQFTTLAAALGAAGLVDTLKGPGPFTVFAPPMTPSPSCRRERSRPCCGRRTGIS